MPLREVNGRRYLLAEHLDATPGLLNNKTPIYGSALGWPWLTLGVGSAGATGVLVGPEFKGNRRYACGALASPP